MKKLSVALLFSIVSFACVQAPEGDSSEKAKPELIGDYESSIDAVEPTNGGRWTEVQIVESAHPYTNRFVRDWTVNGTADTTEMRVVLERFETEAGYDFLTVEGTAGANRTQLSGIRTGEEIVIAGNRVALHFTTDGSVTAWGFKVRVFRAEACICPAIAMPVCGVNGRDYGSPCAAQCAGVTVAHNGRCTTQTWTGVSGIIESAHPYTNSFSRTWTVAEGGATAIRVHFTRIETERGYDFVKVLDMNDRVVASYTGSQTDITSPAVTGNSLKVQLTSDTSITGYGFSIDRHDVSGGCNVDADCGTGNVCTIIQCIRAPCFNVCSPAQGGYMDVTVAQLDSTPTNYSGQLVRVVAEPGAPGAACTRRACTPANPCCNTCSATLEIGANIALRDSGDQEYGCRGDECSWRTSCRQFQPEANGRYTFEGTFMVDNFGGKRLLIDDFRAADCQHGGCSGQLCGNTPLISTCVFRPEYACMQAATCEAQGTGHCGFTQTAELQMCLAGASAAIFTATDTPLSIPDNNATGVTSRLTVTGASNIAELRISVEIAHTYRGDLKVVLTAPSGRSSVIHDRTGGSADNLSLANIPVTGFANEARAGAWTLSVVDTASQDTGTLTGWSLRFD